MGEDNQTTWYEILRVLIKYAKLMSHNCEDSISIKFYFYNSDKYNFDTNNFYKYQ